MPDDPINTMKQDDRYEMVGQVAVKFDGKKLSLVLTGPQWPTDGVNPTMQIYRDKKERKIRIKTSLASEPKRKDPPGTPPKADDDDKVIDLTDLPSDLRALIQNGKYDGPPIRVASPEAALLWLGDRFMTFAEYNRKREGLNALAKLKENPPFWVMPPLSLVPPLFVIPTGSSLYPPMTKQVYDRSISKLLACRLGLCDDERGKK